ncbi:MAG TPA: hypothetical protein VH834_25380 [Solirubrobacteraceae bacterium]|jgi:hypothetical protein
MRELTLHEIDDQLAEQLPSRELMGSSCCRSSSSHPSFTYNQGNGNGNGNAQVGLVNLAGVGNGNNIIL